MNPDAGPKAPISAGYTNPAPLAVAQNSATRQIVKQLTR